jgi:glycosyltransferase involved in cell wall biosynthesis
MADLANAATLCVCSFIFVRTVTQPSAPIKMQLSQPTGRSAPMSLADRGSSIRLRRDASPNGRRMRVCNLAALVKLFRREPFAPEDQPGADLPSCSSEDPERGGFNGTSPLRVILLTNFIPPYRRPFLLHFARRVKALQILTSVEMEEDRHWRPDHAGLNVVVQRTWTLSIGRQHPSGFRSLCQVHIPFDTWLWLWRGAPDVIISGEFGFRTLATALYRIACRDVSLIIWATLSIETERGVGVVRRALRRFMLFVADGVIVNPGHGGRAYIESFGFPADLIFSVPYTIDLGRFRRSLNREPGTAFRLLCVGQLVDRKGVLLFLRALWKWAIANQDLTIDIWIAGEGPLKGQIEDMAVPGNASLRLMGNVEYEKLPDIYRQADILVFPTLADEWGVVVNEAMAMGVPVMGSIYSAAVQELVTDGATGWKFTPTEEQSILGCIDRVMRTPSVQLTKMRDAAAEAVRMLTPEAAADSVVRAVASVHRCRGGRRDEATWEGFST